ncbi:MAG: peptidase [Planctomycetes bacterium]|nr:peptidase [Planctomycetota bacterium]
MQSHLSAQTLPVIRTAIACAALLLTTSLDAIAVGPPDLDGIQQGGVQRGVEGTLDLAGKRLDEPQEVMFYEPGFTVTNLEVVGDKGTHIKVHLNVAADVPLGEHHLRLRTKFGLTDLKTFFVGPYPMVGEAEPNSSFDAPQKVAMNTTIEGVVENEDIDYYLIEAKQGQRISAEVEAIRLGRRNFDPYVAIMDMRRFELASCDDIPLLWQDCYASVVAPADGNYIVMVRESSYGGSGDSQYRLHIGDFPRPRAVYPPGGKVGEELKVTFVGDVSGPIEKTIKLPDQPNEMYGVYAEQNGASSPSPNYMRVSPFGSYNEAEPNNDYGAPNVVDAELPVAINGVIEKAGDVDLFKFKAKKGQNLDVRVYARALRSPLDPVMSIANVGGNDDSGGLDSYLNFQVKEDGEYVLSVTDQLGKGGPDYVYRVEITPKAPAVSFTIPQADRDDTQTRQMASIPKGNRFAILLSAKRENFGGELKFLIDHMPQGVQMIAPNMADNVSEVPILFEAAPDAPIGGELTTLRGEHIDADKNNIKGTFSQTVVLVRGQPNNTAYISTTVPQFTMAVQDEVPFKVSIVEPKVPLAQSGRMNIKVVAERKDGFDEPITVQMLRRSPGFNCNSTVTMDKGKNEVEYPVNANGNAATGTWDICMVAWANVNGGRQYIATQMAKLNIVPEYVVGKMEMVSCEQGQPVDIVCELEQRQPFDGEAKLELFGLPDKVTAEPVMITKDSKQAVFHIKTDPNSPVGQHKSLFCQFTLIQNGEPIVQSLAGGSVLRIDKPRPAPVEKKAEPKKDEPKPEAKPNEPPPKPLSRLEQLRQELAEKAKAKAEGK